MLSVGPVPLVPFRRPKINVAARIVCIESNQVRSSGEVAEVLAWKHYFFWLLRVGTPFASAQTDMKYLLFKACARLLAKLKEQMD